MHSALQNVVDTYPGTQPAKLAVLANAMAPGAVAIAMRVANRLLPALGVGVPEAVSLRSDGDLAIVPVGSPFCGKLVAIEGTGRKPSWISGIKLRLKLPRMASPRNT